MSAYPVPANAANPPANTRQALVLIWAMVTTHAWWLKPDTVINVPYAQIDAALNLVPGTTEQIWNMARGLPAVADAAAKFEATFTGAAPVGAPWGGRQCASVIDYVQIANPSVPSFAVPDITYK